MIVLEYGSFYYPASKRYGNDDSVECDRCGRVNIESCVGYGNYDLCMICVDNLLNKVSVPAATPPKPDSRIDEEIINLMEWMNHQPKTSAPAPASKANNNINMNRTRMLQRSLKK